MRIASIRESFEECGILLARKRRKRFYLAARLHALEGWRDRFNNGEATMLEFAEGKILNLQLMRSAFSPIGLHRK